MAAAIRVVPPLSCPAGGGLHRLKLGHRQMFSYLYLYFHSLQQCDTQSRALLYSVGLENFPNPRRSGLGGTCLGEVLMLINPSRIWDLMGEECQADCKELFVYNSTGMERLRQQASPLVPRGQRGEMDEDGMVSARMRMLYDYRAPAGTRWSPTTEQLRELQALFHEGGMRTPTTAQISRIAARLRAHGRIEGRNVFYWFQNQKARERKRKLLQEEEASSSGGSIGLIECAAPHGQAMQQQKRRSRQAKATSLRPYDDLHRKAAEDERSEVSNPNAAAAFRAAKSIQYIGNTKSSAATFHPPAAMISTRIHMCRDGTNAFYDQLGEVESASSTPYIVHPLIDSYDTRSICRSGNCPLILFPLSPQQEKPGEPPLKCCNHIQAQHSSILPPPARSLSSSLLDLKLAID